jgi:hypothetical protein
MVLQLQGRTDSIDLKAQVARMPDECQPAKLVVIEQTTITTLWMAILAATGATVLVTANALRLLRWR